MNTKDFRKNDYKVDDIFINRWSPRAMSGEPITDDELFALFEAARWAPSSHNNQPWRFVYAKRDTQYWEKLFSFLVEGNQAWVKNAAAVVVVISKTVSEYNGSFIRTHSFDTGSAWENLALQGTLNGLVVHGMSGLDYEKAAAGLGITENFKIEMMFAVGKPGDLMELPEKLREIEKPSGRKELTEIVNEGEFIF